MVWPAPTAFQNLQVGGHGGDGGVQIHWKRRLFVESVQNNTGWLHLAQNCELETICEIWEEPCRGVARCVEDKCVRHGVD